MSGQYYDINQRKQVTRESVETYDFQHICQLFREHQEKTFRKLNQEQPEEAERLLRLFENAIVGKPHHVTTMLDHIQTFLQNENIKQSYVPECYQQIQKHCISEQRSYSELTHAVFHEVYGLKAMACWIRFPNSYAAQIKGTKIFIHYGDESKGIPEDHHLMTFEFKSDEEVKILIDRLTRNKSNAIVNEFKPIEEVDLYTGERVTIMVKPRSVENTITFRRFLKKDVSLEDLAKWNTIPNEGVELLRGLTKTMCNLIISGPLGTGKSTDIKALIGERRSGMTGTLIEKHYELAIGKSYPDKKIIEMVADEESFDVAFDQVLRSDAEYAVIGEIRRVEAEGYMLACERLNDGAMATMHTRKPYMIPSILARMLCAKNQTSNVKEERERVAENIDIVILKTMDESKSKRRVESVCEIRLNRTTGEISTHEIMRWNEESDTWMFRMDLSTDLMKKMKRINPEWAHRVFQMLEKLEKESPIPSDEGIVVFNPVTADPNYLQAKAMQSLVEVVQQQNNLIQELIKKLGTKGVGK